MARASPTDRRWRECGFLRMARGSPSSSSPTRTTVQTRRRRSPSTTSTAETRYSRTGASIRSLTWSSSSARRSRASCATWSSPRSWAWTRRAASPPVKLCANTACSTALDGGARFTALAERLGTMRTRTGSICDASLEEPRGHRRPARRAVAAARGRPADYRMLAVGIGSRREWATIPCTVALDGSYGRRLGRGRLFTALAGRQATITFQNACRLQQGIASSSTYLRRLSGAARLAALVTRAPAVNGSVRSLRQPRGCARTSKCPLPSRSASRPRRNAGRGRIALASGAARARRRRVRPPRRSRRARGMRRRARGGERLAPDDYGAWRPSPACSSGSRTIRPWQEGEEPDRQARLEYGDIRANPQRVEVALRGGRDGQLRARDRDAAGAPRGARGASGRSPLARGEDRPELPGRRHPDRVGPVLVRAALAQARRAQVGARARERARAEPRAVRARVYLADTYEKQGRRREAREQLEKAAAGKPGRYDEAEERRWQDVARRKLAD